MMAVDGKQTSNKQVRTGQRLFAIVPPHWPASVWENWPLLVMGVPIKADVVTPHHTYFDDSGSDPNKSAHFVWAGYIAPWGFWQKFGEAWNAILDSHGLPFWHQSSARARNRKTNHKNKLQSFSDKVIDDCERDLCSLLTDNKALMWAIAVHLDHALHDQRVKGRIDNPKWNTQYRDYIKPDVLERQHLVTLLYALRMCEVLHSTKPEDQMPVSFHCEGMHGDPYQPLMAYAWQVIKGMHPSGDKVMGILDFPPGKSRAAPQLQTADMLAWHVNLRASKPNAPEDRNWKHVQGRMLIEERISADSLDDYVRRWHSCPPGST